MRLFDAHNHLQDERLSGRLEAVFFDAAAVGVELMATKGCRESDWGRVERIAAERKGVHPAFGLHPWFVEERSREWFGRLKEALIAHPEASVGEIGIDRAVPERVDALQERIFLEQLELARTLERPATIHCRGAWGRLIELLDGFGPLPRGFLIHCFGGSAETARALVERGAMISFSGSITRPNNRRAGEAVRAVPADRLLIETDAPDIPLHNLPSGLPREPNEPSRLPFVLAKLAELRNEPEGDLAEITFCNAVRVFGMG